MRQWPVWVAALWWGSLTTVGFGVVPQLFAHLPTPAVAGTMAARLFALQTWASLCMCLLLLMASRMERRPAEATLAHGALPWVLGGAVLALLLEFGVAPRIVARENLLLWHGVGTVMYGLQWLCAAFTLRRMLRESR